MDRNEERILKKNDINKLNNMKENTTIIDLSFQQLTHVNFNLSAPICLTEIILSHNNLTQVPQSIVDLENLKKLDVSYNKIEAFNDVPQFCHVIEELNLSNNNLYSPPYWLWMESPKKLQKLNISNNSNITQDLQKLNLSHLSKQTMLVKEVIMNNCRISKYYELFSQFTSATTIQLGDSNSNYNANTFHEFPLNSLTECTNLEKINLQNTLIHNVRASISIYEKLIEIDLSYNRIDKLPKQFCYLKNLEVCRLAYNQILYLPDEMVELDKLKVLYLNNNELCMLPNNISHMKSLKCLDVYDNYICDVPDISQLDEVDLAQNYLEEPENDDYIEKQKKIRLNHTDTRYFGKRKEVITEEPYHTPDISDDEYQWNDNDHNETLQNRPPSTSSEDWEADDWWVPDVNTNRQTTNRSPWIIFIQNKIKEGHFCPIDIHQKPIDEVMQHKEFTTVLGQFDDYSDDDV